MFFYPRILLKSHKDKPWYIEPLITENNDYRLIANGKMIQCIGKDWLPLVRTKDTSEVSFPFPINIAIIDGELKKVR